MGVAIHGLNEKAAGSELGGLKPRQVFTLL
jgi:hypothetical protein